MLPCHLVDHVVDGDHKLHVFFTWVPVLALHCVEEHLLRGVDPDTVRVAIGVGGVVSCSLFVVGVSSVGGLGDRTHLALSVEVAGLGGDPELVWGGGHVVGGVDLEC